MSAASTLPVLLIIAAQGYQQIEYNTPKQILEQNGLKVVTASNKAGQAIAKDGSKAKIDITTDKVKVQDYQAIFIIGGPGALENLDNQVTYEIMKRAKELNKPFGAICISTRILANAGVINGKKVTGWDDDNALTAILKKDNAIYVKHNCVVDISTSVSDATKKEIIVTAVNPGCAKEFGEKILEVLKK